MGKIEFGKLAVEQYSTEEVISWLSNALRQQTVAMLTAIGDGKIGLVGAAVSQLTIVSSVAQNLDEKVNGKKEPTVL